MARIRTIKPDFCRDERIGRLSRDARLLFIQIWTIADAKGRSRAAPRLLAGILYPFNDDVPGLIEGWLGELESEGLIKPFVLDGIAFLEVSDWPVWQRRDRRSEMMDISKAAWRKLRQHVEARDGTFCHYCGIDAGARFQVDHVTPLARGGPSSLENLVSSCVNCNRAKGTKMLSEWLR